MEGPFAEVTVEDGAARAVVAPAHAQALCDGHFPDDPLLPGAYLAELMVDLATRLLAGAANLPAPSPAIRRCAFLARVRPTHRIVVAVQRSGTSIEAGVTADGEHAAQATLDVGAPA